MSKSIIINGADFSQNGFLIPIEIDMTILYNPESSRDYYFDCLAYLTEHGTCIGEPENAYLLTYGFYPTYSRMAVGTFELNSTFKYTLDFFNLTGAGCGIFIFTDENQTIVLEPLMSEDWGKTHRQIEISSWPSNAKYCRVSFCAEEPYSFYAQKV